MKDSAADDTLVERLNQVLAIEALPTKAKDYAKHLIERLSRPVRITVLGTTGSGKSELINMLVGQSLVPKDAMLPTTEFFWGDAEMMTVTAADGSVSKVHSVDLETISGRNAAFLQVELPAPLLRTVSLLEVVTDGGYPELNSGVEWALRRTDIALWCTQEFGALERKVWANVPDSVKDHAFLVLTKADVLSAERLLSNRVAQLQEIVAEEFHSMYALASLQAIKAQSADGVNDAMFRASGGEALTNAVLQHADRGRRADLDSAHMFLARHENGGEALRVRSRTTQPVKTDPSPPPLPSPSVQAEVADVAEKVEDPVPTPKVETAPKVENVALFTDAIRYLKRRGDSLGDALAETIPGETKIMIDQCVDAVDHLTDLFSQDETGCEAADAFIDELAEATDVMVLMQVEDGDAPAADAVTLLLQLRHDMEMQLAA